MGVVPRACGAIALIGLCGCASPRLADAGKSAHVVICPGIGGDDIFVERLARLIEAEVPDTSAQVWDWTRIEPRVSWLYLSNLQDLPRNRRRAAMLADQLVDWRGRHPTTRLYLLGFSGGTGLVLFSCERLPVDFAIERVVLLSSGLSPKADLTPALKRSRRPLVNVFSRQDTLVCRDFTTRHGTMDRSYGPAAGYCGFDAPQTPHWAAKLRQIGWTARMRQLGNDGSHIGPLAPAFLRRYVLPLLGTSPVAARLQDAVRLCKADVSR